MKIVDKPWGHEKIWAHTPFYVGKILFIKAGESLSLQYHQVKDETVMVLSGILKLKLGDETIELKAGDSRRIAPETIHQMSATEYDVTVVEVSTSELDDVVRLEDRYGRV